MRSLSRGFLSAVCSIFVLAFTSALLAQDQATQPPGDSLTDKAQLSRPVAAAQSSQQYAASEQLPDSPGSLSSSDAEQANSQPNTQTNTSEQQKLQRPVGTAAAEAPKVTGITAAEPTGVAIAPAKQHRVRTIVIRVGALLGAGAALGTVIALTEATPSKPPGAH